MGSFYTNLTVRGPAPEAVAAELKGRSALVSPPMNGSVVVFDEESEKQNPKVLSKLASRLSSRFSCPVLAVLNHDDDVLWFQLHHAGKLLDEYDSYPGFSDGDNSNTQPRGGNARALCDAFGSSNYAEVERVLRKTSLDDDGYTFAVERHDELARALNLPSFGVGAGFNYIEEGELPDGLDLTDLLRVT
jgi:hypothetical protein